MIERHRRTEQHQTPEAATVPAGLIDDEETWERDPLPPTSEPRRKRRKRRGLGCWPWVRAFIAVSAMGMALLLVTASIIGLVIYSSLSGELAEDMKTLQAMEGVEDFQTTRIYDRDGTLLYEIFDEGRRTEVTLDQIPVAIQWATVATEDDTFWTNLGFDPVSIARAAYEWYEEGEIVSGGSTITQQLIRQIVFSYEERTEQTLRRKLKEAALAYVMTRSYSKPEILELYLNEVYYGNLAYGIESAADVYFDKPASQLTIAESAFLAGLVQSPATYDPYQNFDAAKIRQHQVLNLMVTHGWISQADANAAFAEPPLTREDLADPDVSLLAPHYTVAVKNELATLPNITPEMIASGGLRVHTALSMPMQQLGEEIVAAQIAEIGAEANLHNGALVAINPNTGEVLAMIGSVDYENESIDGNVNVILSQQQPGSAMKPLTYAAAFEEGLTPASILWDVPITYPDGQGGEYIPANYDGRFHGPVRAREALANSYNIPALEVLNGVGVLKLLEISNRFGIQSLGADASKFGLALTLGGGELTPMELTSAYGVFANGGHLITPHLITRVEDAQGNIIYEAPTTVGEQVLDPRIAFLISSILSDNVARTPMMGEDSPLLLDFPAAAKTGTTNDFRDNWTVGYTQHLVVGVWAGNTDNSAMAEGTSGLTGAAPIWHNFMTAVYEDDDLSALIDLDGLPPLGSDFSPPQGLSQHDVCVLSSLRDPVAASGGCPRHRREWFIDPSSEDLLRTPTVAPTPTWTPFPTVEGQPPKPQVPYARIQIEPGIWAIGVLPVNEESASGVGRVINVVNTNRPETAPELRMPPYCEVPQPLADAADVVFQLFIDAPADPATAIRARNFAWNNGWPIVPGIECPLEVVHFPTTTPTPEITISTLMPFNPGTAVNYTIAWPQSGQGVYGVIPIIGTAIFGPEGAQFYKVEISGGTLDGWRTMGTIHNTPVVNGTLETLHADALAPGDYTIRLVLVGLDGNFIQPTHNVPIRVLSSPPTATPAPTP